MTLGSYPHARIAERYNLPYWVVVSLAESLRDMDYRQSARGFSASLALIEELRLLGAAQMVSTVRSLYRDLDDAARANPWRPLPPPAAPKPGPPAP